MDFNLTEEQQMVQDMSRNFAQKEVLPKAAELDETSRFPEELVKKMGELGLMGMSVPEEYGGAGFDYVSYAIAMEEISRACASTAVIMSVNNSLVCEPLLSYGSEEIKTKYLTPLAEGKNLGCFALTEPGAGSDAGSQKTVAQRKGDHYVVNGTKNFITNAPRADYSILFTMTDKEKRHKGITAFIIDMKSEGVTVGKCEKKLGIKASETASLILEDLEVPVENRLGDEGMGFRVAMQTLDAGRIGIAAQAVGIARACLEDSVLYAKERRQFGQAISSFQAIQWMIADMATEIEAARLLTYQAAYLKDRGERYSKESSMAKLFASEAAMRAAVKCIQIHGGYGYIREYPAERYFRDAKITEIYEGTSEIQRLVIASAILKD
ncbi:MAG: acyl-CoA dehydrogenase [Deltaproteobacteria bacterium]|nr:acyl-CoA dehydrogenase [Deltaproteobacteria bacterium]NIS76945.1 acyl-CoA dehydrogenase [Deltaproteobacteria bacterium]